MKHNILDSWRKNAKEWNAIIENKSIPSRKYTNKAILETIRFLGVKKVADLGCGEGWLCRELTKNGIEAVGFDATPELIELAKTKGDESYHQVRFEAILNGPLLPNAPFDSAVFNFSLYQKDNLDLLLQRVLDSLNDKGVLLIQTIHPFYLIENGVGYRSQWLSNSWKGLPGNFKDDHSWYARTMEDWIELIQKIPQTSFKIGEIIDNEEKTLSLLLILKKQNG